MELPFEKRESKTLVKKESESSPKFGKKPDARTVKELLNYGIVNIDKPSGPTSHQVSAYVKNILEIKKAGHSGTLDPKVTGALPVALGKATKVVQTLLKAGKEYVCLMHLHKPVPEYKLNKIMTEFTGKIKQLPPIKSSVKRRWRFRKVYYIEILEIEGQDVLFKVGCQAGTYVRKLCFDIGKALGIGAHMAELRRTKAGPFDETTLFSLQDLADAYFYCYEKNNELFLKKVIQPMENAVAHLPKIWVFDTTVDTLCHGASLAVPGISRLDSDVNKEELVGVFTLKNELICLGTSKMTSKEILQNQKGIAVCTEKVLMEPGIYPSVQK
ncbi:RNA-guided pseudouridylation complex pseudouridine synthase subunit Cbf5 [Candidatus Woesearchaeota archaeon]|nr:RNA-guided pseudouridylation complex pseudouridine synthase subunit Cbf5 [Candidatus Woesearchaeota archaeon]